MEERYIIQVDSDDYAGILYIRSIGNFVSSVKMSRNSFDAKLYKSEDKARKEADRAEKFVKEAYERGYTCYGWSCDDNGVQYPTVQSITTKVVKVKLISLY